MSTSSWRLQRAYFTSRSSSWLVLFLLFIFSLLLFLYVFGNGGGKARHPEYGSAGSSSSDYIEKFRHMDGLAVQFKSTKSSLFHNYTRVYLKYFAEMRYRPISFLEFGIYKGDSVKLWEEYFPNADLHFADINKTQIEYFSKRSTYHYLDQRNETALREVGRRFGPFDVIIDDASHWQVETITTFKTLFPHLKPGGIYVYEDSMTAYRVFDYGDHSRALAGPNTMQQLMKDLVDEVNFFAAAHEFNRGDPQSIPAGIRAKMNDYSKRIDSVHFYPGLTFILTREEML